MNLNSKQKDSVQDRTCC